MIKKILMCWLILNSTWSLAQESMEFYDADGKISDEASSFYYILIDESSHGFDTVKSYYTKTDKPRSIIALDEAGRRNGLSFFYHENGQLKGKASYKAGSLEGNVETWYPSGKSQSIESFSSITTLPQQSAILQYWDSLGNQIIKDGEGICTCVFGILSGTNIIETGTLKAGVRDASWIGFRLDGSKYFDERYNDGEFVSGISFDKSGKSYSYTKREEAAIPSKGLADFYEQVRQAMKYPKEARRNRIEGKVFVEFIVDKEGNLTDVRAIKGIGYGCDEVAVDAVKSSPRWIPGKQRGQPVRMKMVLPLDFKLG
jgi:TonB family protein